MARPRSIPYDIRAAVFLSYRRLGKKVYPTAKRYRIARSTVGAIVKEFLMEGFSEEPRASLSPTILAQAQEHHLRAVVAELRQLHRLALDPPIERQGAVVSQDGVLRELSDADLMRLDPLPLGEALTWHLKGTGAERISQEARHAVQVYNRRCADIWREVCSALEDKCGRPAGTWPALNKPGDTPRFFYTLVDLAYREAFKAKPCFTPPPQDWKPSPSEPKVLTTGSVDVAAGEPKDHLKVKEGARDFLETAIGVFQKRATELIALHRDLTYLPDIVEEGLGLVDEQVVRKGICPLCPYPEVNLEPAQPLESVPGEERQDE